VAIVRSMGALQATAADRRSGYFGQVFNQPPSYGLGFGGSYANIYAAQPNVRTCVDFLARNIAQLGYQVFRRVSDTDRERLADHELAQILTKPNPYTDRYRLFESLIADLGIYFNAYWLKVRQGPSVQLVRLPPESMRVEGGLLPAAFIFTVNGEETYFPPGEIVYFNGYNPLNALMGLSPLETLRRILAEETAAGLHRERYWLHASRMEGVIERPLAAPRWTPDQKQLWREQWQQKYTGIASTGTVAVLEDGMTFKQTSFSARDSEYLASRKLTREECAAQYHIPLPMVGILEHATFSNIKEQHKQLYADCLGPWLEMVSSAIERQLLPECRDTTGVYGEFNIAEKLKGSFEEQSAALRALVGRPMMTANEGRARLNLPSMKDDPSADQLAQQQGGPAAAGAIEPAPADETGRSTPPVAPADGQAAVTAAVRAAWTRQATRLAKVPAGAKAGAFDHTRYAAELTTDLTPVLGWALAAQYAARVTDETYLRLVEGADAFHDREVPPCDALA